LINVTAIRTTSPFFYTRVNTLNIAASDCTALWVIYSSYHNLTYRAFLLLDAKVPNGGLHYSLVYGLIATSKYPDVQYAFTQGLSDEPLKAALKTFTTTGYNSLGYNAARDRMFETVDDYGGDTIECIYSGRKIYATTRTQAQNQNFDTEHTWPQSFFNENEPMKSDIHHLFPTYSPANNARSNYPFGFVVSNITYQDGGSKLGRDINNNIVFEPRDVQKGNSARAIFYFVIRYQNWENYLALAQETALRQFHLMDTVNARERLRNDRVKQYQNNRNPFADHPELVERIAAFYTTLNTPPKAEITASPYSVKFDTLANAGDTVSYFVSICNYGNTNLTVSSVTSNNPVFTVESFPSTVSANQFGYARIKFTPAALNTLYTGELTINNSDSTLKIALNGISGEVNGITPVSGELPRFYNLSQNYPNPFNPVTNIKFSVPEAGFVKLVIFDIMGREVKTLVSENLKPGVYLADWDASLATSGVYFYKLITGKFTETKRMILVK
ncbi:MAG: T9SS type A sorting domain-containing protein, partial [Ignavibacteria bacterium]|nr:T9SS type A sorting domain-containing protein [Ignavibacteria bacterium]